MDAGRPNHNSCVVLSLFGLRCPLFRIWTAVWTTSNQKVCEMSLSFIISLAIWWTDLFWRSTTPFCWGVPGIIYSLLIPCLSQNYLKSLDINSPPLSKRIAFSFLPVWFSANALKFLNFSNTSYFSLRKETHVSLEKSSMNSIKWRSPPIPSFHDGPHRSIWTSSISFS